MKSIYLTILILVVSVSAFAQVATWSPSVENTKIVSEQEFFELFEPTTPWKHIIRLKGENPSVNFQDLQNEDDFSSLQIPVDSTKAYKLYNGKFVIFYSRPNTTIKQ